MVQVKIINDKNQQLIVNTVYEYMPCRNDTIEVMGRRWVVLSKEATKHGYTIYVNPK